MQYGPLSAIDIEILKEKLDARGLPYEITIDRELLNEIEERRKLAQPRDHRSFQGLDYYLYIEIGNEAFLLVRPELEKMGVAVPRGSAELPGVDEEDEAYFEREKTKWRPLTRFASWMGLAIFAFILVSGAYKSCTEDHRPYGDAKPFKGWEQ